MLFDENGLKEETFNDAFQSDCSDFTIPPIPIFTETPTPTMTLIPTKTKTPSPTRSLTPAKTRSMTLTPTKSISLAPTKSFIPTATRTKTPTKTMITHTEDIKTPSQIIPIVTHTWTLAVNLPFPDRCHAFPNRSYCDDYFSNCYN